MKHYSVIFFAVVENQWKHFVYRDLYNDSFFVTQFCSYVRQITVSEWYSFTDVFVLIVVIQSDIKIFNEATILF